MEKHLGLGDGVGVFNDWDHTKADSDLAVDKDTELVGDNDEVVTGGEVNGNGEVVDILAEGVELAGVDTAEELS